MALQTRPAGQPNHPRGVRCNDARFERLHLQRLLQHVSSFSRCEQASLDNRLHGGLAPGAGVAGRFLALALHTLLHHAGYLPSSRVSSRPISALFCVLQAVPYRTQTPFFERIIASARLEGTLSFLVFLSDCCGYVASICLLLLRIFAPGQPSAAQQLERFSRITLLCSAASLILIGMGATFILRQLGRTAAATSVASSSSSDVPPSSSSATPTDSSCPEDTPWEPM